MSYDPINQVLFKFKESLSPTTLAYVSAGAEGLKTIPGVSNLSFGQTFTTRGQGFTHMLAMEFESREALDAYSVHPLHVKFVDELIKPNIAEKGVLAMDTERSRL